MVCLVSIVEEKKDGEKKKEDKEKGADGENVEVKKEPGAEEKVCNIL